MCFIFFGDRLKLLEEENRRLAAVVCTGGRNDGDGAKDNNKVAVEKNSSGDNGDKKPDGDDGDKKPDKKKKR